MTSILLHQYVEQVDKLIDDNRLVEAIEHCRHILHSYPRHIDTYRVMGKALLEKQDYAAATDLFLRILCADPNDFISHVGLSIIYKEESQYDQALWHLERAHEIQPYNVAIQGELRQLYAVQTETRPGIIPLSRGALSRLYMQGELYQQAISELRRILAEEPDRMDLQVLLAEALWRNDQRIDAEDVCLNVLQELPNCIVLNAILAEIWLQTGRIPEAQKYLHRLQGLTQQTRSLLDKETITGKAFATEGAFPLPEKNSLEFLHTGIVMADKPAVPADDWVGEVKFDTEDGNEDSLDQVVLEPESGMHSYDWLADIGDTDGTTQQGSEADWFSQDKAKNELNISTGELNAEWLADLRGDEDEQGFQPLDLGNTTSQSNTEESSGKTDWFSDEDENLEDVIASLDDDLGETAVAPANLIAQNETEDGLDWLDDLEDAEPAIQIDATSLMDDHNLMGWEDSEPHVVEEPKTPFWLSTMAAEELEAVELNPEEALNWMNEDSDDFEDSEVDGIDVLDDGDWEIEETAVEIPDELADSDLAATTLNTDNLGDADDWLAALTEGEIDSEISWGNEESEEPLAPANQIQLDATTDALAALSDADNWLESAESDLDAILQSEDFEEEEFPNLTIPELEGDDIADIPDWLDDENLDLSEEPEAAVSSKSDPQETPQPEEPKVESGRAQNNEEVVPDALDWLDDFTSETADSGEAFPDLPIETEGMPSWLANANDEEAVEVVDEWDSQSADIPDWLQDPVQLSDLDEADNLLDELDEPGGSGLTGLLSEMEVSDEPLTLNKMDSLMADWDVVEEDDSLTNILNEFEVEEMPSASADSDQPIEPAEMGLTGLLSNLSLQEDEEATEEIETENDFLAGFSTDDESDLADFLMDESSVEQDADAESIEFGELDLENVSLTALLSDADLEEAPEVMASYTDTNDNDDDWLSDLTDLVEAGEETELDVEEEVGLTGMLANLWPDQAGDDFGETAVSSPEDSLLDLENQTTDEMGLTELLAGIDYAEDAIDSEPGLPDFDIEPVEPPLAEIFTKKQAEPDEEAGPVSAEDTSWLTQLEVDTGSLAEQDDQFNMAEETGLDWLTTPDEPEADEAEAIPEEDEMEVEPVELDGTAEDWDDAMSWLEELAAQHDEPLEDLPSVAENMLDEELDTVAEPTPIEADDDDELDMDWLADLSDSAGFNLESAEENQQEMPGTPIAEEEILSEVEDLFADDEVSWLDELATDRLAGSMDEAPDTMVELAEETVDSELDDDTWLDELYPADESEEVADELADFAALSNEPDEAVELADLDMDAAETELAWLDMVEGETAVADDERTNDEAEIETVAEETDDEAYRVTGVTDALKENSGIEEAEADLEEALAWLDELDGEAEIEPLAEAPLTLVNEILDEADLDDEPETIVVTSEPDDLALALDRLEWQVREEGIEVPETAVTPLALSTEKLNAALDWIEQQSDAGLDDATVEEAVDISLAREGDESAIETTFDADKADNIDDEPDLFAMSEDPEAWLEQFLSDDLDMDVDMEPPPIQPSEDALFVTDDARLDIAEDGLDTIVDEPESLDMLLDDATLDEMPDDPDAAVAWLDQLVSDDHLPEGALDLVEDSTDEAGLLDEEDDPEAWLEQMLSGDMALDIDMEPPPIKPSEDAMFVTDDARETEPKMVIEPVEEPGALVTAVSEEGLDGEDDTNLDFGDMEDDPEAWLEQMLSDDFAMDVEMEPPPIKPSEDAMFITDDGRSTEEPAAKAEMSEPAEPTAENLDDETDIIADVPDDPDEAMLWLEQLAARQGAAIEELPSVTDADAEPEMPDWMVRDLDELAAEPDIMPESGVEEVAKTAELFEEALEAEVEDTDIDDELPDWLGTDTDRSMVGQTDWLQALPEVDVDTWLSAEEEATVAGSTDEIVLPDTGPLTPLPQPSSLEEDFDDDLFEPVMEPSTGAYNVDEAKLSLAQEALGNGRITEAIDQFKELVAAGTGMMTIIAELEQAVGVYTQNPAISQLLGDAYMRNGQLQKALASYRFALDQM